MLGKAGEGRGDETEELKDCSQCTHAVRYRRMLHGVKGRGKQFCKCAQSESGGGDLQFAGCCGKCSRMEFIQLSLQKERNKTNPP